MTNAIIQIDDVSFAYAGSSDRGQVIDGVSFAAAQGEFFCMLGPSGCGKSTVLNLIAGFEHPTSGTIRIDGRPIRGPGVDRGVVFQGDDSLFNWLTAEANVAFGPRLHSMKRQARRDLARRYIDLVGLTGHADKFPGQLSGGMRQRIQIARVLANDPEILLMDEPFGALDAQTRSELQDELVRIWATTRKTIVFITHDIGEAVLIADRVGVMRSGPNARLRDIIDIDLPRPRSRSSPEFGRLYEQINALIVEEVQISRSRTNGPST